VLLPYRSPSAFQDAETTAYITVICSSGDFRQQWYASKNSRHAETTAYITVICSSGDFRQQWYASKNSRHADSRIGALPMKDNHLVINPPRGEKMECGDVASVLSPPRTVVQMTSASRQPSGKEDCSASSLVTPQFPSLKHSLPCFTIPQLEVHSLPRKFYFNDLTLHWITIIIQLMPRAVE
jgi:hypothetical protein